MLEESNVVYRVLCTLTRRLVALALLLIFSPILFVFAVFIYIESRESPIFIQDRLGLDGRKFKIVKLRTFYSINTVANNQVGFTKTGKFIRRYRIDELPQLVNIILGQMNFIGPRPEIVNRAEDIQAINSKFKERLAIKPGITGLAQVTLGYTATNKGSQLKLKLDLYYIRNRSLKTDIRILIKTIKVVLNGSGV